MITHTRDARLSLGDIHTYKTNARAINLVARTKKTKNTNTVPIKICGRNTSALVYSGASVSVLNGLFRENFVCQW